MQRIVIIGAGSYGFTHTLAKDIFSFPNLKDSTLVLVDIDKERLELARKVVQSVIDEGRYPATIETTTDRKQAFKKKVDFVICTIAGYGVDVWRYDVEIPIKFGVDFCLGDSKGVPAIFRALRTIPIMLDICKDMEKYCPNAVLLNYTNPMPMICRAMQKASKIKVMGMCHSVQGTAERLAKWINTPMDRITYKCAGVNHQAWFVEFKKDGKDAYPLIREVLKKNKKLYKSEFTSNEIFSHLGYYLSEDSKHNAEYNWWFLKRKDLLKKHFNDGGWGSPGGYAKAHLKKDRFRNIEVKKWLNDDTNTYLKRGLERSNEYTAYIINALTCGEPFEFNGNIPNSGIITNLPKDACVDSPVLVNKNGFNPIYVGALPPQCAALNNANIAVDEMTVEASLTGNPELVFYAAAYDPLTSAVLSLSEIKNMIKVMLEKNKNYLPQFRSIKI